MASFGWFLGKSKSNLSSKHRCGRSTVASLDHCRYYLKGFSFLSALPQNIFSTLFLYITLSHVKITFLKIWNSAFCLWHIAIRIFCDGRGIGDSSGWMTASLRPSLVKLLKMPVEIFLVKYFLSNISWQNIPRQIFLVKIFLCNIFLHPALAGLTYWLRLQVVTFITYTYTYIYTYITSRLSLSSPARSGEALTICKQHTSSETLLITNQRTSWNPSWWTLLPLAPCSTSSTSWKTSCRRPDAPLALLSASPKLLPHNLQWRRKR